MPSAAIAGCACGREGNALSRARVSVAASHNRPVKKLGQHFLACAASRARIIGALNPSSTEVWLEIGAGRGEMTAMLAPRARRVIAVELDARFLPQLRALRESLPNITVTQGNILAYDISRAIKGVSSRVKVFGNVPYYISSPIIEHLIRHRHAIVDAYLTLQWEFAERLCAGAGTKAYGALSCFTQYYMDPHIVFRIKRGCFSPAPKVDSALVHLAIRTVAPVDVDDPERFFAFIGSAFRQRRKMLRNSLKGILPHGCLERFCAQLRVPLSVRSEELSLADFALLFGMVSPRP